jgi:hypothetical protein
LGLQSPRAAVLARSRLNQPSKAYVKQPTIFEGLHKLKAEAFSIMSKINDASLRGFIILEGSLKENIPKLEALLRENKASGADAVAWKKELEEYVRIQKTYIQVLDGVSDDDKRKLWARQQSSKPEEASEFMAKLQVLVEEEKIDDAKSLMKARAQASKQSSASLIQSPVAFVAVALAFVSLF